MLQKIATDAPQAKMHPKPAAAFDRLRQTVRALSGVDFLARCGDVFRDAGFHSAKDGVANRSWHKTGRAFDYDQSSNAIVIVSEIITGRQFFRTYLRCSDQTGLQGLFKTVPDVRGHKVAAWLYDFTAAAQSEGFARIPAWDGWQNHYNRREFWHYEMRDGLTWAAAMAQIAGSGRPASIATAQKLLGLGDKGTDVAKLQTKLVQLGLLGLPFNSGVFDLETEKAVTHFQMQNRLHTDGLVGPLTRTKLGL